jgi:tetratricopeptide (TPR) repeat protein
MGLLKPLPAMRAALVALTLVAVLAGCQTQSGVREPAWPYPVPPRAPEPRPAPTVPVEPPGRMEPRPLDPQPLPGSGQPLPGADRWPRSAREVSGPAVLTLMDQAATSRREGRPEAAVASLERAVRIEPRNAFIWSELAAVYIDAGNYDQAEAIAQRANSLARGNPHVEAQNWQTIASARAEELQRLLPRD